MSSLPRAGWCLASLAVLLGSAPGFYWHAASAPVEITVSGRRLSAWQLARGVAPQPVIPRDGIYGIYQGKVAAATEALTFIPYGSTKLRVVAPLVIP